VRYAALSLSCAFALTLCAAPPLRQVRESERKIPVVHDVDVVVVGGSTGAVAAAQAAAAKGASVVLVAPKPYLGEDMCATLRLWLDKDEQPATDLARKVYSDWGADVSREPVRPMHVKKTLDEALLAVKAPFLFSTYATGVLRDAAGRVAGVTINNRAGRQAIVAKVIVDATSRAWVARMAGAKFRPYAAGKHKFTRYVVGGKLRPGGRELAFVYKGDGSTRSRDNAAAKPVPLVEYALELAMADGSYASFANAEQAARDLTYDAEQKAAADELFQVPPDAMRAEKTASGAWRGAASLDVGVFRPSGAPFLYVLGGCAGVSREQAQHLLRPSALMAAGAKVGEAAAEAAKARPALAGVKLTAPNAPPGAGDSKEVLTGLRAVDRIQKEVAFAGGAVPVLGEYDVVVVGGGTAGAPAGIAAGRAKAKTLVLEALNGLGGVGTLGMISTYWWGYRGGFTKEAPGRGTLGITDPEARQKRGQDNPRFTWDPMAKAEWLRAMLRKEKVEVWFGVQGAGAWMEGNRVKGVVVATPQGRGVVLAKAVIDATGNADLAASAGAPTVQTNANELAVQGTGLPSINLGAGYTNTDFTIVDENDMVDVWHMLVYAKNKYQSQFDLGQLIDSRERRRVVGDHEMTILDQMTGRTYPDTVTLVYANFDTHGYTVDPYFMVDHPEKGGVAVNLPYRCLLPKGIDGLLVAGIGMSVHRDALPLVRMQPDIQNQGYAAGVAASMAAQAGVGVRGVDIKTLQKKLVDAGIVPERVLGDHDSNPIPEDRVAKAAEDYPRDRGAAAVLLSAPESASVLLRKQFVKASGKDKFEYAMFLAVMGDASGIETLVEALDARKWDEGWQYTGMGQFGNSMSEVDRLMVAMGRTRDRRALPAILRKIEQLSPQAEFSHYRAISLALESIGDAAAADALAALLAKPGIRGYAITSVQQAAKASGLNHNETQTRGTSIREIDIARALYRCGDKNGLGRAVLEEYTKDLRGHVARHAQAVLDEGKLRNTR
jgi:flavin-dependent dehydrogenase